jgi:hypothetical protein
MRYVLIVLLMLFGSMTSAMAQVSIGIGLPGVNIGINFPLYPELVQVPGYPVYYAPRLNSNYFFYDGMYWVYQDDNWYASSWYNGPWGLVDPWSVPPFVLRIPVRYYRQPPMYFRGWQSDAPPRWGEHWGNEWQQRRSGWDRWDRNSAPAPAPLPVYQRKYSGDRYPQAEQQRTLRNQNYHYQPRDAVVRQHYQEQPAQRAPAPSARGQQGMPQERSSRQQERSEPLPPMQQRQGPGALRPPPPPLPPMQQPEGPGAVRSQPPQRGGVDVPKPAPMQAPAQQRSPAVQDQRQQPQQGATQRERGAENVQRPAPAQPQQRGPAAQDQKQQPQQGATQREQQAPRSSQEKNTQGKGALQEPARGQGQEKDRDKTEERSPERNR